MTNPESSSFDSLLAGFRRFHGEVWRNDRERWNSLAQGQSPHTMVISCSDSRVDPVQIFDTQPGSIFVVRNVAALVPPYETTPGRHGVSAALEFAVQFLKVKEVIVLGHEFCGGCKTALSQDLSGSDPGQGGFVASWIGMLDERRGIIAGELGTTGRVAEKAMELAAIQQSLANLRSFPYIRSAEDNGWLTLRGTYFSISDGMLHVLDESSGNFTQID